MRKFGYLFATVVLLTPTFGKAETPKRKMVIDDLFKFRRVADPQISPDGELVAYVVSQVSLANNSSSSSIWLAKTDGSKRWQLTRSGKKDNHPRWSPDGSKILFESNREEGGQLWVIGLHGGEAKRITNISTRASTAIWSPDGKWIAFVSAVFPEFSNKPFAESDAANKKRNEEIEKNPVKAKVLTKLFYRHWDEWVDDKRQHLFVIPAPSDSDDMAASVTVVDKKKKPANAKSEKPAMKDGFAVPRDLTPGDRDGYPTSTTFGVGDDFCFTSDSSAILFTAPPEKAEAWTTDYNIYRVATTGGKPKRITDNPAADGAPRMSHDGKSIYYRAQKKPGYEADRWDLMVMDARGGKPKFALGSEMDLSIGDFLVQPNGSVIFTAEQNAKSPIFIQNGKGFQMIEGHSNNSLSLSSDGKKIAFSRVAMTHPAEVFVADLTGTSKPINVSKVNEALLAELDLPAPESVSVAGAGGTPMQMWILKPPGFDPAKKWPLAFLVHGGPQGAWEDGWSYRWCPQIWAAQGYVVALPNPRGSTGFGQKYVDEISGDWGGKCYGDLMGGLAYLEKQPYIDTTRMASAGASFGGYMMNWFQGNTTKFKTLISHCGVYNFDSMYALTDELWFDEWEHAGPPWGNHRESYEKYSPHRKAANFKTPMLIIHNDYDFRVPVSEGFQMFTTLQRLGVPSKMINFPDEGHWVLKPQNSAFWHKEVFAWLAKYAPPGGK